MAFFNGSMNIARYSFMPEANPGSASDVLRKVYCHRITPLQLNSSAAVAVGWCDYLRGTDDLNPDSLLPYVGSRDYLLGIRIEEKKVPASVLRKYVKEAIAEYQEGTTKKVKKADKDAIRDNVHNELMKQAIPVAKTYGVLWDPSTGDFLTEATSKAAFEHLEKLVFDTFGPSVLRAVTPNNLVEHGESNEEHNLGSSFLTWLLYGVAKGYRYDTEYTFGIDSKVKLASHGTISEISIKGGSIEHSKELKQALSGGSYVAAMRFMFQLEDKFWAFNLDAKDLWPKSVKVPAVEAPTSDEHNQARKEHMDKVLGVIKDLYAEFLRTWGDADDHANYSDAYAAWVSDDE
jgi:hypothetical protein